MIVTSKPLSPVPPNENLPERRAESDPTEEQLFLEKFRCYACTCGKKWRKAEDLFWSSEPDGFYCADAPKDGKFYADYVSDTEPAKRWSLADEQAYRSRMVDTDRLLIGATYKVEGDERDGKRLQAQYRWKAAKPDLSEDAERMQFETWHKTSLVKPEEPPNPRVDVGHSDRMEDLVSQISTLRAQVELAQDAVQQFGHRVGQLAERIDEVKTDIEGVDGLNERMMAAENRSDGLETRLNGVTDEHRTDWNHWSERQNGLNQRLDTLINSHQDLIRRVSKMEDRTPAIGPHHTVESTDEEAPVQAPNLSHVANEVSFVAGRLRKVEGDVKDTRKAVGKMVLLLQTHLAKQREEAPLTVKSSGTVRSPNSDEYVVIVSGKDPAFESGREGPVVIEGLSFTKENGLVDDPPF